MTNYKFVKDCAIPEAPDAPIVVPNDSPINPLVALPANPAVPLELIAKFLPCKNEGRYPCPEIEIADTVGPEGTAEEPKVTYNCVDEADLSIDFDIESYCCDVMEDGDGNTITADKIIMTPQVELSLPYPAIISKGWLHYFNKNGVDAYISSYNASHTDELSICERCWTSSYINAAKNYSASPIYKIWYFQSKPKDPDENPQKSYLVPVVDINENFITDATWHTENDKVLASIDRCSCNASVLNDYDEETADNIIVMRGNGFFNGSDTIYGVTAKHGTTSVSYPSLTIDENSFSNMPAGAQVSVDIKCPAGTTTTSDMYVTATGYTTPTHTGSPTGSVSAGSTATITLGNGQTLYDGVTTVSAKNYTNRTVLPGDTVCLTNVQGSWGFFDCAGDTTTEISISGVTNGKVATYQGEPVFCELNSINPGYVFTDQGAPKRCTSYVALTTNGTIMYNIPGTSYWYIDSGDYRYSLNSGQTFYKVEDTVGQIHCYGYYPVDNDRYYFPVNQSNSTYCFSDNGYLDRSSSPKIYNNLGLVSNASPTVGNVVLTTNNPGKHSVSYTMTTTSAGTASGDAYLAFSSGALYAYGTIRVTLGSKQVQYPFNTRTGTNLTPYGGYSLSGFNNGSTFTGTFTDASVPGLSFKPYRYITESVSYSSPVYEESSNYYIDYNSLYRYKLSSSCLNSNISLTSGSSTLTRPFKDFIDNSWICQSSITIEGVSYSPVSNNNSYNLSVEKRYSVPNVTFTASDVNGGNIDAVVYKVLVESAQSY